MARKPLRSQLNQIRAWVRQGRTDAWIAHQLDVPASELREFRRRHELSADDDDSGELDLRDEIEAEIAAEIEAAAAEEDEEEDQDEDEEPDAFEAEDDLADRPDAPERDAEESSDGDAGAVKRRRRRRGGRGRGRKAGALQATFDHGEAEGFGLWLDPAVADNPVYGEHWSGHRKVEVTIEPDQIVIRRS